MKGTRFIAPVIGLVIFFAAWEAFVRAFDIRPFVLEAPSRIVHYLLRFPNDYFRAALITMKHAVLGFAVAICVAIFLGAAMAASTFLEQATQPILTLIAVTPFAAYIGSVKIGLGAFSDGFGGGRVRGGRRGGARFRARPRECRHHCLR